MHTTPIRKQMTYYLQTIHKPRDYQPRYSQEITLHFSKTQTPWNTVVSQLFLISLANINSSSFIKASLITLHDISIHLTEEKYLVCEDFLCPLIIDLNVCLT